MNRALLPLLLALPLGCRGTFDLDKYVAGTESGTASSADTVDGTATTDASTTTTDESDTTDESGTTDETTDTTDTDTNTDTDTDTSTDTDAECMIGLMDVGGACIGLKQTLQLGGSAPTDLEVADFTDDDFPYVDLLVAGAPVNYFAGSESGMFGALMPIVDATGTGLATVDWNVDAKLDFVTVTDANFEFFYSNGNGTFNGGATLVPGGYDAAVGDLDGDADDDLVLTGDTLKVLARDMNNNLMLVADLVYPAQRLVLANLNDDNNLDIALAMTAMNQVTVILSDGALGFQALTPTALLSPADVAVASIDILDGLELIAVGGEQEGQLLLLNVQGDALAQLGMFPVGGMPRAVAVGDINDDQLTDVAVGNASTHDVSLLLGERGSLTNEFRLPVDDVTDSPESIEVVDLDNDGHAEIIVGMTGSNRVLVYGHMQ